MKQPDLMILANDLVCSNVSGLTQLLEEIGKFGWAYSQIILTSEFCLLE